MSNTPETDALYPNLRAVSYDAMFEHARKLERQRNALAKGLEAAQQAGIRLGEQRDELLAALEAIIANEQPYNELTEEDRERAIAAIKRAKGQTP